MNTTTEFVLRIELGNKFQKIYNSNCETKFSCVLFVTKLCVIISYLLPLSFNVCIYLLLRVFFFIVELRSSDDNSTYCKINSYYLYN